MCCERRNARRNCISCMDVLFYNGVASSPKTNRSAD